MYLYMDKQAARSRLLKTLVTPKEHLAIAKEATRRKQSISTYLRHCALYVAGMLPQADK